MAHIHTEPYQHDVTASGFIVRLDGDEPRIMLHHHLVLKSLMQFGGHVELDEDPWRTIARELREEAGYDLDQLAVLQPRDRLMAMSSPAILLPQPACVFNVTYGRTTPPHFHDDITWAFTAKESPRHSLTPRESRDIVLVSRSQLLEASDADIPRDVQEIMHFIFETCLPSWEAVQAIPLTREREQ